MNHDSILHLLQNLQETGETSAPAESDLQQLDDMCSASPKYNPDSPPYMPQPSHSETSMQWTHKDSLLSELDVMVKTIASLQKDVVYLTRVAHATNHCVRDIHSQIQKNMDSKEKTDAFQL
jgi:hypothetical protein